MAGESTQVADPNKMAAPIPDASVLPQKIRRPDPPKYFKGCKCSRSKCKNSNCSCYKNDYPCTWKCECGECENTFGDRESDPNTGPESWCKCTFSKCLSKNCQCVKDSHRCSSKCECKNCANEKGVRGSDSEQTDDTSSMGRKRPRMGSREANKLPRISS